MAAGGAWPAHATRRVRPSSLDPVQCSTCGGREEYIYLRVGRDRRIRAQTEYLWVGPDQEYLWVGPAALKSKSYYRWRPFSLEFLVAKAGSLRDPTGLHKGRGNESVSRLLRTAREPTRAKGE